MKIVVLITLVFFSSGVIAKVMWERLFRRMALIAERIREIDPEDTVPEIDSTLIHLQTLLGGLDVLPWIIISPVAIIYGIIGNCYVECWNISVQIWAWRSRHDGEYEETES
jgi:hypothetical protein